MSARPALEQLMACHSTQRTWTTQRTMRENRHRHCATRGRQRLQPPCADLEKIRGPNSGALAPPARQSPAQAVENQVDAGSSRNSCTVSSATNCTCVDEPGTAALQRGTDQPPAPGNGRRADAVQIRVLGRRHTPAPFVLTGRRPAAFPPAYPAPARTGKPAPQDGGVPGRNGMHSLRR